MFVVRAVYPQGGHTVTVDGRSHFQTYQEAAVVAEDLSAYEKKAPIVGFGNYQTTTYIVVEEK